MKLRSFAAAIGFTAVAFAAPPALAADEQAATADAVRASTQSAAPGSGANRVAPHSHVAEKVGIVPAVKADLKMAEAKRPSKAKHFHPRDGK